MTAICCSLRVLKLADIPLLSKEDFLRGLIFVTLSEPVCDMNQHLSDTVFKKQNIMSFKKMGFIVGLFHCIVTELELSLPTFLHWLLNLPMGLPSFMYIKTKVLESE